MLIVGNLKTMLLVCKRWTTVAYSNPRLRSRIVVMDDRPYGVVVQGAHLCDTVDYLLSVLARSQASPLQVELYLHGDSTFGICKDSPQSSSLLSGSQAAASRDEAIGLILDNRVLTRCTHFVLRCYNARFDYREHDHSSTTFFALHRCVA